MNVSGLGVEAQVYGRPRQAGFKFKSFLGYTYMELVVGQPEQHSKK